MASPLLPSLLARPQRTIPGPSARLAAPQLAHLSSCSARDPALGAPSPRPHPPLQATPTQCVQMWQAHCSATVAAAAPTPAAAAARPAAARAAQHANLAAPGHCLQLHSSRAAPLSSLAKAGLQIGSQQQVRKLSSYLLVPAHGKAAGVSLGPRCVPTSLLHPPLRPSWSLFLAASAAAATPAGAAALFTTLGRAARRGVG